MSHENSCYDNGTVVLLHIPIGQKAAKATTKTVYRFNDAVKTIALDASTTSSSTDSRKDCPFIVGTASGHLIYHRVSSSFFTQKADKLLFAGSQSSSAVASIAWYGSLVAWADASHVRVMDISSQSAICHLKAPVGVGVDNNSFSYPCKLFWQSTSELLVGWADTFRTVKFTEASSSSSTASVTNSGSGSNVRTATTSIEWKTDCIICGVFPFDGEHVVVLGYYPPDEKAMEQEEHQEDEYSKATNGDRAE